MERWAIGLEFADKKHCIHCPLRDRETDGCNMQMLEGIAIEYDSWEEQMENCPLQALEVKEDDKE